MKADLFYSPTEKIFFILVGYSHEPGVVVDIIKELQAGLSKVVDLTACSPDHVRTFIVSSSRKYKYNRVFWVRTQQYPKDSFVLGESWTMDKWLSN